MANINLTKALTAVLVGGVDELIERNDRPIWGLNALDAYRIGGVILTQGAVAMGPPRFAQTAETLATALTPLAVKSIAKMLMAGGAGGTSRTFVRRSIATGAAARNWAPASGSGALRFMTPTN